MNNIALGQYVYKDSIIHKLDPRTKILSALIMMVTIFLIPNPSKMANPLLPFYILLGFFGLIIILILLTKVSIFKYLNSIKSIIFIILFAFVVQMFTKVDNGTVYNFELKLSWLNISIGVILLILFIVFRKHLRAKLLLFVILCVGIVYLLHLDLGVKYASSNLVFYEYGIYNGAFYSLRILVVIMISTALTLTTKPTDIAHAIEWMLHPLTLFKINVSIFAMMLSLALRYIPTIFNEANKILKAQASRGVDFKEGNLKQQIGQIVALLIPIFVIAYKRSEELAYAMEARAYIPGAKRTSINVLKFKGKDLVLGIITLLILGSVIAWRVIL